MKKLLLTYGLIFFFYGLYAQHKYEIGIETGVLFPTYNLKDAGNQLEKKNGSSLNRISAITMQRNTLHRWVYGLSAGTYTINYNYNFKQVEYYSVSKELNQQVFLMGLVGYKLPINKKLNATPSLGLAANLQIDEGKSDNYIDYLFSTGIEYASLPTKRVFGTVNAKFELTYSVAKRLGLSLAGNYMQGISKRVIHEIDYKINNGPLQYATMTSLGSFLYLNAGIRYRFL